MARVHTLEDAKQLELVVDILLLLLQVNRACTLVSFALQASESDGTYG